MIAILGSPSQAGADPAPMNGTAGADIAATALAPVIVTAQRRSENLQNVPISVTALDASQLSANGVAGVQELSVAVPGLSVQNANGYATPYIRGVGSSAVGPGIENPVALYVDGVYYAASSGSLLSFNNISQIEVLKGPQGTLFGRNTTGGVIQITTRTPTQARHFDGDVSYGNYDTSTVNTYVTGGVSAELAADLAIHASHQGTGYGRNLLTADANDRTNKELDFRSKWLSTPAAGTRLTLVLDYSDDSNSQLGMRLISGTAAAPLTGPAYGGSPWDIEGLRPLSRTRAGGVSLSWNQNLGFARLVNITAYRGTDFHKTLDLDGTATPYEGADVHEYDSQVSEEVHLLSREDSRISWLAGAYYFSANGKYDPVTETLNNDPALDPLYPLGVAYLNTHEETRSVAGFAQSTVAVLPATQFTLGARYTYERRKTSGSEAADLLGGIPLGTLLTVAAEKTFDKPTFRVALDHHFTRQILAYVSYNTGYKSGGFEPSTLSTVPFEPEELDAAEAGIKSEMLEHRLRLNASFFHYHYKNIQIERIHMGAIGIINGAEATMYGLDADLQASVTQRLTLFGGLEVVHDRFDSFEDAPTGTPGGGVAQYPASAVGHRLPVTPDFMLDARARYVVPLASGDLALDAVYAYDSGWYAEPDNVIRQPSFNKVNLSARWQSGGGEYVEVWGKNLSNAVVQSYAVTFANGNQVASYQPPRTYGVTVGYAY